MTSFSVAAGLLDEASAAADDVEVLHSSRSRVILSRLAVVVGVLLVVAVLVGVRLFVHVGAKTDWASLCIPAAINDTDALSSGYITALYPNVTLAPCNLTTAIHLPPTTWAAYVPN